MALTRPLKEGSVTTYQQKVALGFPDILASEMDADLDTIYAAWNGGVATANLIDGSVTFAKLAPDAQLWRDTGSAVTPGTNFATRLIQWGSTGTVRHFLADVSGAMQLQSNYSTVPTDTSKSQWVFALNPGADLCAIFRSPPGTTAAFVERLRLDGAGILQLSAGTLHLPPGGRVLTTANLHQASLNEVGIPGQDTTKPVWKWGASATNDNYFIQRAPANTTSFVTMLGLDTGGNLMVASHISTGGATSAPTAPGVRITGGGAGIRCQSVGTALADGYSNPIGFGWDGTLKARVDTTVIGTVTVTSDARVKHDVQEDVPGLDAVRALRPISFEYDQTKRPIGFPKGRYYGLIAQDVQPHAPLVVEEDDSDDHWLEIDYRLLVPVLIRAIQELAEKLP